MQEVEITIQEKRIIEDLAKRGNKIQELVLMQKRITAMFFEDISKKYGYHDYRLDFENCAVLQLNADDHGSARN